MRSAFALVSVLLVSSRARADELDRTWFEAPIDGGTLAVSTSIGVAHVGGTFRFGFDVMVQIPVDRWFRKESPMKRKRWSAAVALPGAFVLAGAAKGKETRAVSPAASTSASIVTTSAPSVAGVVAITAAPLVDKPLPSQAIRALVSAAWKAAGVDRDEALSDLAARARASALAPEVRLRAYRGIDAGARVYRIDDSDRTTLTDGTQSFFEARLSWRLDRLVFADEEVAIERIRLERAELKQRISAKVLDLVLRFQRARRAANDQELLAHERDEAALVAVESLLALDAITAGAASGVLMAPSP